MKSSLVHIIILLHCAFHGYSQDLHWSQPVTALQYINPAFTGVNGKFSVSAGHRSQWNAIHSNFKTSYVAADYQLGAEKNPELLNVGAFLYNDLSGGGSLRTNCIGFTASSLLKAGTAGFIGAGLSYQMLNTILSADKYSWGSQYSGERYDPSLPSGEKSFTGFSSYSNLQAGICYMYREESDPSEMGSKRKFVAGYSLDHLTRPVKGLTGSGEQLMMKHCVYLHAYLPADPVRAIKPFLLFQAQGPMIECVLGALYRTAFGEVSRFTGIKKGAGFSFGASYRVMDAVIPTIEYEKGNVIIGLSYDINVSRLTPVSMLRGGPEISLRITPKREATIPTHKPAPNTRSM